jgi:hypothetical protein
MKLRHIIVSLGVLVLNANVFAAEWQCFQYKERELVIKGYKPTVILPLNEKVVDFLAGYKGSSLCVKGVLTFNGGYSGATDLIQIDSDFKSGVTYKYQFNAYDIKAATE